MKKNPSSARAGGPSGLEMRAVADITRNVYSNRVKNFLNFCRQDSATGASTSPQAFW